MADYVVIGAGTAGCVVAARLAEDPNVEVVVLEAGGEDTLADVHVPELWPALWGTAVDWAYTTTPQAAAGNVPRAWPRGKVIGGSSSINGMIHLRGNRADYDAWAYAGNYGWDYESLLPLFKRMEDVPHGDHRFRGVGGPLSPRPADPPNPVSAAFVEAAHQAGYPITKDLNGEHFEAAGLNDLLIADGRRQSVSDAYLRPAMERPNLTVTLDASVEALVIAGERCTGVRYSVGGEEQTIDAGEVIVCAGTIDSPALLLRSGIGPAADLQALGIPVVADLPGVGRNLHDHLLVGLAYESPQVIPAPRFNLCESSLFLRSRPELSVPDLMLLCVHVPLPGMPVQEPAWTMCICLVRPASRGTVTLRDGKPVIDPAYLSQAADLEALERGVALAREIVAADALTPWRKAEAVPGPGADVAGYIRIGAASYFHPVGTCAMGIGAQAVVSPELKVHGVDGLRVADASIMPSIVSANTNTAALVIAEKAAELIASAAPVASSTPR